MTRKRAAAARVSDLVADPENRRTHPERNLAMVAEALRSVGAARSIVIDEDDLVLAGNGVINAATQVGITKLRIIEATGDEIIAVRRRDLTPDQKRLLAMYDNRTAELAEWSTEQLAADLKAGLDLHPFWTEEELAHLLPDGTPGSSGGASLFDRFGVPPFSVLDARQGYWQDRKRAWLSLGIESELGRGDTGVNTPHLGNAAADGLLALRAQQKATRARGKKADAASFGDAAQWQRKKKSNATPGGSPRPAMRLRGGKTIRGDGRGRPLRKP